MLFLLALVGAAYAWDRYGHATETRTGSQPSLPTPPADLGGGSMVDGHTVNWSSPPMLPPAGWGTEGVAGPAPTEFDGNTVDVEKDPKRAVPVIKADVRTVPASKDPPKEQPTDYVRMLRGVGTGEQVSPEVASKVLAILGTKQVRAGDVTEQAAKAAVYTARKVPPERTAVVNSALAGARAKA